MYITVLLALVHRRHGAEPTRGFPRAPLLGDPGWQPLLTWGPTGI